MADLPVDMPDSLQDLCILYCIGNLPVLVNSLSRLDNVEDGMSMSQNLGNQLLQYFLKFGIYSENNEGFVDQLLQSVTLCSDLVLKRSRLLTEDSIVQLSNKKLKSIELTYYNDDHASLLYAKKRLVMNSSEHLTKLCLYCRSSEVFFPSSGNPYLTDDENLEDFSEQKLKHLKSFTFQHMDTYSSGPQNRNSYLTTIREECRKILKDNTNLLSLNLLFLVSHPAKWFFCLSKVSTLRNLQYLTLSCSKLGHPFETDPGAIRNDFFTTLPLLKNLR